MDNKEKERALNKWKRRLKYNPAVLFIAESPPRNPATYFYFDDKRYDNEKRSLSYHLFNALNINSLTKYERLKEFVAQKYYFLIDAIESPKFNKKRKLKNKKRQIKDNEERVLKEVEKLNPKQIVILACGVYDILSDSLKEKGLINVRVHFPDRFHQREFKKDMKKVLKQIR